MDGDVDGDLDGEHDTEDLSNYQNPSFGLDNLPAPRMKIELDIEAMKERDWRWKRRMTAIEMEGTTSQPPSPPKKTEGSSKDTTINVFDRTFASFRSTSLDHDHSVTHSSIPPRQCLHPTRRARSAGEDLTEIMSDAFDQVYNVSDMETFCDSDSDIDWERKRDSEAERKVIRASKATVDGSDGTETD